MKLKQVSCCLFSITFFVITAMSFASCSLNKEKTVFELTTTRYSDAELNKIKNFVNETQCSYDVLNEKYPIECTRNGEYYNRVTYVGEENEVLPIYFNDDGTFSYVEPVVKPVLSKAELYEAYESCKDAYELMEIDTTGLYWFFSTADVPDPIVSSHFTTDGYYVDIYYDEYPYFNITGIECYLL